MSYPLLKEDILFYQRFLKAGGFYQEKPDGKWGAKTDEADKLFVNKTEAIKNSYGRVDNTSETNIISLTPTAQILARRFLLKAKSLQWDVRILSGTRTYAEQDALYKMGRLGNSSPKITHAKGGCSNHNFGIAWDIGIFEQGKYIQTDLLYKKFAGQILVYFPELEWGGNWKSFKDFPHYQLKAIDRNIETIRSLFEQGKKYV